MDEQERKKRIVISNGRIMNFSEALDAMSWYESKGFYRIYHDPEDIDPSIDEEWLKDDEAHLDRVLAIFKEAVENDSKIKKGEEVSDDERFDTSTAIHKNPEDDDRYATETNMTIRRRFETGKVYTIRLDWKVVRDKDGNVTKSVCEQRPSLMVLGDLSKIIEYLPSFFEGLYRSRSLRTHFEGTGVEIKREYL